MKRIWRIMLRELDVLADRAWIWWGCLILPAVTIWLSCGVIDRSIASGGIQYLAASVLQDDEWLSGLFLTYLLLFPALSVGMIARERERETLGLLLMTRLTPFTIVAGKVAAIVCLVTLLALSLVPALLLEARFLQPNLPSISFSYAAVLVGALVCAPVCLAAAAWMPSRLGGYLGGAGALLVTMFLPGLMIALVDDAVVEDWLSLVAVGLVALAALILGAKGLARPTKPSVPFLVDLRRRLSRRPRLSRWLARRHRLAKHPFRWLARREQLCRQPLFLLAWLLLWSVLWIVVEDVDGDLMGLALWWYVTLLAIAVVAGTRILSRDRQREMVPLLLALPGGAGRLLRSRLNGVFIWLAVTYVIGYIWAIRLLPAFQAVPLLLTALAAGPLLVAAAICAMRFATGRQALFAGVVLLVGLHVLLVLLPETIRWHDYLQGPGVLAVAAGVALVTWLALYLLWRRADRLLVD